MTNQYSNEVVEMKRREFIEKGYELQVELVGGEWIGYYLMSKSECPEWPSFTYLCASKEDLVYGVSEEIPEQFRKYVAYHEYIEATRFKGDGLEACLNSLKVELEAVPENIRGPYQEFRRDFFRDLIAYQENQEKVDEESVAKFKRSGDYLDSLVAAYSAGRERK